MCKACTLTHRSGAARQTSLRIGVQGHETEEADQEEEQSADQVMVMFGVVPVPEKDLLLLLPPDGERPDRVNNLFEVEPV